MPAGTTSRLSTWDAFVVPLPFARAVAVIGAPLVVARDADRARARKDLEQALGEVTVAAERQAAS